MEKRDLSQVIKLLLAVIPEDEIRLRQDLNRCSESALYCPPESMDQVWERTRHVLNSAIGTRSPSKWIPSVVRIFNGIE